MSDESRLERPLDFSLFFNDEQHELQNERLHTYTHEVVIEELEQKNDIPWRFNVKATDFSKSRETEHEITLFLTEEGFFGNCSCAFMTHKKFTGTSIIPCYHVCNVYWKLFHQKEGMERKAEVTAVAKAKAGFPSGLSSGFDDSQKIAVIPPSETDEFFMIKEQRDDTRMLAVMDNMFEADMVYAFMSKDKKGKKKVNIELSWEGIKSIALEYGAIVTDLKHVEETDTYVQVYFTATDLVSKVTVWGAVKQAKFSEKGKPNRKAFEMAISKAQRNAIKNLLPTSRVKPMLKKAAKMLMTQGGHKASEFTKDISFIPGGKSQ